MDGIKRINKYLTVGHRIVQIREKYGLSQKKFADKIGISRSFLSELELGITRPSIPILLAIEYIYGFKKEWIITGDEPIYIDEFNQPVFFPTAGLGMSQKQLLVWIDRLINIFESGDKGKTDLVKAQLRLLDPGRKKK